MEKLTQSTLASPSHPDPLASTSTDTQTRNTFMPSAAKVAKLKFFIDELTELALNIRDTADTITATDNPGYRNADWMFTKAGHISEVLQGFYEFPIPIDWDSSVIQSMFENNTVPEVISRHISCLDKIFREYQEVRKKRYNGGMFRLMPGLVGRDPIKECLLGTKASELESTRIEDRRYASPTLLDSASRYSKMLAKAEYTGRGNKTQKTALSDLLLDDSKLKDDLRMWKTGRSRLSKRSQWSIQGSVRRLEQRSKGNNSDEKSH